MNTNAGNTLIGFALKIGAIALLCLSVTSCGEDDKASSDDGKSAVLAKAFSACKKQLGSTEAGQGESVSAEDLMSLGDEGNSITVENRSSASGDFAGILTAAAVNCLLNETDAPDSLGSEIQQTTAMMGRQSENWDGLTFEWSYHPDSGISGVLKQSN